MIDPHCKIGKVTMKSNLRFLPNVEAHPVAVLQSAMNEQWDSVFVCGFDKDKKMQVYSSSNDGRQMLWTIELARDFVLHLV